MNEESLSIAKDALASMESYFCDFVRERGGAIGVDGNKIVAFYPIQSDKGEDNEFIPCFASLNKAARWFERKGLSFGGIIHSHRLGIDGNGSVKPSAEDLSFFLDFAKENPDLSPLYFPIITRVDGVKTIAWYRLKQNELALIEKIALT